MPAVARRLLVAVLAVAALAAFRKRPVRQPQPSGSWEPVDR
jgi:hypothetical protein